MTIKMTIKQKLELIKLCCETEIKSEEDSELDDCNYYIRGKRYIAKEVLNIINLEVKK